MMRTPRELAALRESRARRCQAKVDGARCRLLWVVASATHVDKRAGDANPLLCVRHARSKLVELWTDDDERREVKYLRQQQLNYDRMMRGRR